MRISINLIVVKMALIIYLTYNNEKEDNLALIETYKFFCRTEIN